MFGLFQRENLFRSGAVSKGSTLESFVKVLRETSTFFPEAPRRLRAAVVSSNSSVFSLTCSWFTPRSISVQIALVHATEIRDFCHSDPSELKETQMPSHSHLCLQIWGSSNLTRSSGCWHTRFLCSVQPIPFIYLLEKHIISFCWIPSSPAGLSSYFEWRVGTCSNPIIMQVVSVDVKPVADNPEVSVSSLQGTNNQETMVQRAGQLPGGV